MHVTTNRKEIAVNANLNKVVSELRSAKILVIGDVMLDE